MGGRNGVEHNKGRHMQSTVFLTNYDSAGNGRGYKRSTRVNTGVVARVAEWKHGQTDGETTSLHIKGLG